LNVLPLSKVCDLLFPGQEVTVITSDLNSSVRKIRTRRNIPGMVLLSFYGVDDRDAAEVFRNAMVVVAKNELPPLPDGEYYVDDLKGMTVVTAAGEVLGRLDDVFQTGSNDVYSVRSGAREYLIPAIREVIVTIDMENRTIVINPMKGLLDNP